MSDEELVRDADIELKASSHHLVAIALIECVMMLFYLWSVKEWGAL